MIKLEFLLIALATVSTGVQAQAVERKTATYATEICLTRDEAIAPRCFIAQPSGATISYIAKESDSDELLLDPYVADQGITTVAVSDSLYADVRAHQVNKRVTYNEPDGMEASQKSEDCWARCVVDTLGGALGGAAGGAGTGKSPFSKVLGGVAGAAAGAATGAEKGECWECYAKYEADKAAERVEVMGTGGGGGPWAGGDGGDVDTSSTATIRTYNGAELINTVFSHKKNGQPVLDLTSTVRSSDQAEVWFTVGNKRRHVLSYDQLKGYGTMNAEVIVMSPESFQKQVAPMQILGDLGWADGCYRGNDGANVYQFSGWKMCHVPNPEALGRLCPGDVSVVSNDQELHSPQPFVGDCQ